MKTNVPAIVAACASTVIALVAVVGLTATAQQYVQNRQIGFDKRLAEFDRNQKDFAAKQKDFAAKQDALAKAQEELANKVVTQEQLDKAMQDLIAEIVKIIGASKPGVARD